MYLVVICDYVTRYPEAILLHSTGAAHITKELIGMFARADIPSEILTDHAWYQILHSQPIHTTPHHGLVERFNEALKIMLRIAATKEEHG